MPDPLQKPVAHGHGHTPPGNPGDLRSSGRRLTRQRKLIWDALTAEPDEHLSAEDVVNRIRLDLPRINPSTVYRTLELLVDEGLLLRTDLGSYRSYYEPAHHHPHHHLVCERCGTVTHIHEEALGNLREHVEAASGYRLGEREITLFGVCQACRTPQSTEA